MILFPDGSLQFEWSQKTTSIDVNAPLKINTTPDGDFLLTMSGDKAYKISFIPFGNIDYQTQSSGNSGYSETFELQFNDPDGVQNIRNVYFMIAPDKSGDNAAYFSYAPNIDTLYLRSDGNNFWFKGSPGTEQILRNSQVSVNLADVVVTADETLVNLSLPLQFTRTFTGEMNVYMFIRDRDGTKTGWELMDTYMVTNDPRPPMNLGIDPSGISGAKQTFTAVFRDGDGWRNLERMLIHIGDSNTVVDSVYLLYYPDINKLYLRNDDNSDWFTLRVGKDVELRNSQVRIPMDKVSVIKRGYEIELKIPMFFYSGFNGTHTLYLFAKDNEGVVTGWEALAHTL
jgi:hypothetical protein